MGQTLIEKVADALKAAEQSSGDWRVMARAALEAMREPSIEMMAAGWIAQGLSTGATESEAAAIADKWLASETEVAHLKAGWAAAIDAALAEG